MLFPSGLTIDYQKKKVISIVVHTDQIKIVFWRPVWAQSQEYMRH